jgi:hypothetical protein
MAFSGLEALERQDGREATDQDACLLAVRVKWVAPMYKIVEPSLAYVLELPIESYGSGTKMAGFVASLPSSLSMKTYC